MNYINKLNPFRKPKRVPSDHAVMMALTGAVVIHTEDGHNVVLTPDVARTIGPILHDLAKDAEAAANPMTLTS